ncbi:MAG: hypothetical protein KTR19_07495 [Hyphomicrobiales bacterium]|nr:hypothetical protein [Hyphomicrobiales bacterium]
MPAKISGAVYANIFAPTVGAKLPDGGRDGWFDATKAQSNENTPFQNLPLPTAAWRSERENPGMRPLR